MTPRIVYDKTTGIFPYENPGVKKYKITNVNKLIRGKHIDSES
jgi:hypothetical protein